MTRIAVLRQRRQLALLVMTGEAGRMIQRAGLLVMFWHNHTEIGNKVRALTERRKLVSRRLERSHFHMTVRTDPWRRPLARKELLPVTIQARRMFGKLGDIRKRFVAFTNLLPVFTGKLVT